MAAVIYVASILFFLELVMVDCIRRSDCPVGCDCDSSIEGVKCTRGNWKEPPTIPNRTQKVLFESGNFGFLKRTEACRTYNEVVELLFLDSNLTHVSENFYRCVPNLGTLFIRDNRVQFTPKDMFEHTPKITNLSIEIANMNSDVYSRILLSVCQLELIHTLRLATDLPVRINVECLSSLPFLRNLYLKAHGLLIETILKPLQNISHLLKLTDYSTRSLSGNMFKGFQIKVLDLSDNLIESIEEDAFAEMSNLETIDLSRNRIKHNDINVFINLPNLRTLVLAYSWMPYDTRKLMNYTKDSLFLLPELVRLDLTGSGMTLVEKQAINNQSKLKVLDIGFNAINNEGLLSLLNVLVHSSLKKLNLTDNPLQTLNGTFDVFCLIQLEEIILKRCAISWLQARIFSCLKNLRILDLSLNELHSLPYGIFTDLTSLVVLHLEGNHLSRIGAEDLGLQSSHLGEIYLENNELEYVRIQGISAFKRIDLSGNDGKFYWFTDIKDLPSLEEFSLSSQIKLSVRFLEDFQFNFPKLKMFNCSHNGIQFASSFFNHTPYMEVLDLTSVSLSNLLPRQQKELFGHLTRLHKLYISNCDVIFIIPKMFENLEQLELLDAKSNKISDLDQKAFYNLSRLTELHLDNNAITNVTWETFVFVPGLRYLSLKGNPLICTCEIFWLYAAVTTNRIVYIENSDDHICMSPSDVGGIRLRKLNLKKSDCQRSWLFYLKPFGYISGILTLISLVFVAWRKRWQIRYTFFLANAGLGRYEEFHDDHHYIYDAFVAYSGNDLDWVEDQLMENIDSEFIGEQGFKLCVHDRDWLAGVDIVENIVKSIVESRKTILVLSKEFAKSKWCQFELATAHMRLEAEGHKKGRLLIILLDDIPAHLLTPRLVYFLSLRTYLEWPKDPLAQPNFWKALHKSLRKELLYAQNEA